MQLCRFRNTHPAFRGRVYIDDSTPKHQLHARWYSGTQHLAVLRVDFQTQDFTITHTPYDEEALPDHVAALDASTSADRSPYSLELESVSSLDGMDTDSRMTYRHQMAELALVGVNNTNDDSSGSVTKAVSNGSRPRGGTHDSQAAVASSVEGSGASEAVGPPVKHHLGQGLSLEAVASIDGKLGEGDCLIPARKSARQQIPDELSGLWCDGDTFSDQKPQTSSSAGDSGSSEAATAGKAVSAEGSEQNVSAIGSTSAENGADSSGSESNSNLNEVAEAKPSRGNGAGAGVGGGSSAGGRTGLQMQQLDLSWAWKLPDEPVCKPTSQPEKGRVAAAAN